MKAVTVACVLAAATALACSSTADTPARGPIAQSDFPAAVAAAYCPKISGCCSGRISGCEAAVKASVEGVYTNPATATSKFDPDRARKCVDAIAALQNVQCASDFYAKTLSLAVCSGVLDGTVEPGGTCNEVVDCKRGTANGTIAGCFVGCAELGGAAPKRCRKFEPTTTPGAACEEGFDGTAAVVAICGGELQCTAKACAPKSKAGESCAAGKTCESTLFCKNDVCIAPKGKAGDSCDDGCIAPANCTSTTCETPPSTPWSFEIGFVSVGYACDP
ncbi:hypothetical protein BH09MYX1_BH09MYX1_35960 [soil metagenome]